MKLIYIISCLLFLLCNATYAQVYTCKGGTVDATIRSEFSQTDIANANASANAQFAYLGMTFLDNSSNTYNCHAYAWHLREGNTNRVWINNVLGYTDASNCWPQSNNIHKYWTDGCFIQVCNEADADKVHYYCGDHSAAKSTTNPGYYESKWGQLPLYRHTLLGVPYEQQSTHNYYASTKMSGDASLFCSGTRTFSVKNISGATYSWTYSGFLSVVGATNTNQLTVQPSGNGAGWVQVVISTPCSGITATQRIDFPVGAVPPGAIQPGPMTPIDVELYIYPVPGATSYKWYKNNVLVSGQYGTTVDIPVTCGVNTQISVEAINPCGTSSRSYRTVKAPCWGGGAFMVSPNPATSVITISPRPDNTAKSAANANKTFTEIRIYNMQGELKKYQRYNKAKQASLPVHDLKNGIYFIEITNGTYKEKQQLSIQK